MPRPDIVFLHCHDLGRHLALYGDAGPLTPGLERLADEGVLFEQLYSTSTVCTPSRGSIQTGLYPHQVGLFGLCNRAGWELSPGARCIPHYLGEAGYRTVLLGLQHETRDWRKLGYQERFPQPSPHPALAWEIGRQAAELITSLAPREERAPLYLNVGIREPHRHDCWELYEAGDPDNLQVPSFLPDTPDVRRDLARYEGLIRAMDEAVGTVLKALDETGLARDALVLFTTDHGLAFPRAKTTLYDAGIGAAGIARWPTQIRGGRREDCLLSHVDWLPTLLDIVGVSIPKELEGRSFWPMLCEGAWEPRECVYAEGTYEQGYNPARCVRTREHKLIRNYHSEPARMRSTEEDPHNGVLGASDYPVEVWEKRPLWELYDLVADSDERCNRIQDQAMSDVYRRTRELLVSWLVRTRDPVHQIYETFHYPEGADAAIADPNSLVRLRPGA